MSILFFCLLFNQVNAQNGKISGIINDTEANDILPFANVYIKGSNNGTTSDFEGDYTLNVEEGIHTVVFSFVGYETLEVTGVEVIAGQTTSLNVNMKSSAGALDEIIISTTTARDTESSVLTLQKNSINLMDGLASQTFAKIGAGEVSAAVKTVPGVSVQDGKYVYVRGLGDRYTKSILNGIDIPGLDPDRNTIQLDIFPTNILDNIQVVKSSTADLPADFTGGMINIVTKDFPTREEYSLSIGGTYNPSMHLKSNYLQYEGGGTDFLGFDDGTRDLPVSRNQQFPRPFDNDAALTRLTQRFTPVLAATTATSPINYSAGFTAGNQYNVGEANKLGYFASVSYKNNTEFYEDYESNSYLKPRNTNIFELRPNRTLSGDFGKKNVLVSAMAGLAFKTSLSKYSLNVLHLQNGESTAGVFNEEVFISDAIEVYRDNLEYTQRAITNLILNGKHSNNDASWIAEWKIAPSLARVQDKDVRITAFEYNPNNDSYIIRPSSSESPTRIWRDLEEINLVSKLDLSKRHQFLGRDASLKFGGGYIYKQRDFSIDQYQILIQGSVSQNYNGDANQILAPENIWTPGSGTGSFINGFYEPTNTYDAYNTNIAGYVSQEFKLSEKLKTILGVRFEKFDLFYTGQNNLGNVKFEDEHLIDKADFFPSANFIYSTTPNANLRFSYARTTARPSFKEASIAQIYDPLTNRTFIGNIDIRPTYINNLDLRYEIYGDKAQLIALSGFYKSFRDPIELTIFSDFSSDNFQPRNVNDAMVFGAELEIRRNLGFITEGLSNFDVNMNISLIDSRVDMDRSPSGEYESKERNLRDGEDFDGTRPLQGQSPYLINTGINYTSDQLGLQAGVFYNVQGKTLEVVGIGTAPDVYTMPFHNLNFNLSKSFGEARNSTLALKVSNILNDAIESRFQSFNAEDQIFSKRNPGTPISLSYSFRF
ncbi:MAG: TonB-dependent receptor [Gillisia sp.]